MPVCDEEHRKTFKEDTRLHIILTVIATCIVLIAINIGIPIKVLVLLVFSITMTFSSVFVMVWCFAILEEKRILEESKKEYEKSQPCMEQPQAKYNSTDDKESVKNIP